MEVLLYSVGLVVGVYNSRGKALLARDLEDLVLDLEVGSRGLEEPNYNLLLFRLRISVGGRVRRLSTIFLLDTRSVRQTIRQRVETIVAVGIIRLLNSYNEDRVGHSANVDDVELHVASSQA